LDNLVHRGEIPVMVGLFVDPGVFVGDQARRTGTPSATLTTTGT
jgi:hypothetical protein